MSQKHDEAPAGPTDFRPWTAVPIKQLINVNTGRVRVSWSGVCLGSDGSYAHLSRSQLEAAGNKETCCVTRDFHCELETQASSDCHLLSVDRCAYVPWLCAGCGPMGEFIAHLLPGRDGGSRGVGQRAG